MKKSVFILYLVLVINQLLSAQVNTDTFKHAQLSDRELGLQYLKKANNQRTTAWIMLGAGIAMEIIGSSIAMDDLYSEEQTAEMVVLVGAILTVVSVPIFISGAKNRGRAEILLRHENIRVYNNSGSGKEGMLSLGLSIPLRGSRK